MCFFLFSYGASQRRPDWTNTCVLEPCKNDASEREERKSPNPGKRSAKRSVRVYAANCDCVTCLSKKFLAVLTPVLGQTLLQHKCSMPPEAHAVKLVKGLTEARAEPDSLDNSFRTGSKSETGRLSFGPSLTKC